MHGARMIYGYARVSADAQDLTSQLAQLKAAGCEKVFREKITGTTADRPQLILNFIFVQSPANKVGNRDKFVDEIVS